MQKNPRNKAIHHSTLAGMGEWDGDKCLRDEVLDMFQVDESGEGLGLNVNER